MENFNQIKITTNRENAETSTAVMTAMDFIGGLMIEDFSDIELCKWDYVDEELIQKDKDIVCISGYVAESESVIPFIERLRLLLPPTDKIDIIFVKQCDWANNWKKYYKPIRVGKNIVIKPSWEKYEKQENDVIVELDPGMAFGTGTHETTRMCMQILETVTNSQKTVLDIGCGSGILSITALLLGAKSAFAVDIDPMCIPIAYENAKMNGISKDKYTVISGNVLQEDLIKNQYDIIVSNIIADVIIPLSAYVPQFIKDDGVFICSGIIDSRIDDVKKALIENNFKIISEIKDGEWFAISAKNYSA